MKKIIFFSMIIAMSFDGSASQRQEVIVHNPSQKINPYVVMGTTLFVASLVYTCGTSCNNGSCKWEKKNYRRMNKQNKLKVHLNDNDKKQFKKRAYHSRL